MVESLESRTLLSVGPIPTVPTPVAHWTFDEGSGTTANDSSGNGFTGTLGAGASWTTGNVGTGAISVAGSATGVVTVTGPVVNTANSFTVSAWVDLSLVSGYETIVSIAGTNVAGFFLQLRGDSGTFSFTRLASDSTSAAATEIEAPSTPVAGTWYHVVGVDDATAGTLSLYVDGQSMGSVAYTGGWQAMGNTLIGNGFYSGAATDFVHGSIDDVQFFSSALSAAQVAALDQPAAYAFDDGAGTTAADVSGHSNTLTLGSGASWAAGVIGSNSLAVNGTANGNATYSSPVINTALPFSVSAWVNLNSLSGTQTFVSIDGSNTSAFYLQYRSDVGAFAFTRLASDSDSAQIFQADATAAPVAATWYNLVGVNDVATNQLLLYVDGALQSTVTYTGGWQGTGATVVGAGRFNGARSDFTNGDIDDVHFYDSPLNAADAELIGTNGNSIINIATQTTGVTVSPTLFGAFMEDINFGGEGGIYNDEVRNSGFNDATTATSALNSWAAVKSNGVTDSLASDTTTGPTTALTQSGKLTITSGVTANRRAGISNSGYFGVAVAPSTSYSVMFYAKATAGFTGPLTVDLESNTGTVYATATISSITTSWAQYNTTLTTGSTTPTTATNKFIISTNSTSANGATIWFGATYLYPPSYQGDANHLRIDLMQYLQQLQPAIFRVPGGNYLEGNTDATKFEWSNTIGPVQDRPGHDNSAWGYWSTDGMGLDEYLQMAEEVGAQPILAVFAGYTLNGSSDTGDALTADVTDAVNELHYVLDPTTTSWGAERAANGHPAPYNVNYVEIGNEDGFSSTYATRYPLFYNAIHAAFPQLKIIATNSATGGSPYNILDDHFYNSPAWFEANSNMFNNAPRTGTQIFIGEYASNEGSPTNDMNSALGDSAWLLGLERNSDLVTMSSYAPLWANVNGIQWNPDLIGFNNTTSYGSPSYWAQVMLSQNHGTTVVSDTVSGATGLQTLVTKTGSTYYLTVINTVGTANTTTVNLSGVNTVSSTATVTSLVGATSAATNSITNPTNIIPVTSTLSGLGTSFTDTFPGFSITILKFTAVVAPPTVVTPAAANPSPANGKTTNLSVLGADPNGEANLSYTWATTGAPPAPVNFSINGTNAAKNSIATFTAAGTYNFTVTIQDAAGLNTPSSVTVIVNQTLTTIAVTPNGLAIRLGTTQQFASSALDQFGAVMSSQPSIVFTVGSASVGSITTSGLYTAPTLGNGGSVTVLASSGAITGSASLAVTNAAPAVLTPASANPNPDTGATANLSVLGTDNTGEANLTYTWVTTGSPPAAVAFSINGTNASKNTVATFATAGTYTFQVSLTNGSGLSAFSTVSVIVNQTATTVIVTSASSTVAAGATDQFAAAAFDQFGVLMATQPTFAWSVASGAGSINSAGVYIAASTAGSATVRATVGAGPVGNLAVTVVAPLAWYQADASSGTTLTDSSGNNNAATLTGATAFVPGVSGNAVNLTGGNALLPTGIVSTLSDFTISTWMNVTTLANWDRIFDFGTGTTDYMFLTPDAGGTNQLRFAITTTGGGGEQQLNGPAITPGVWTQVTVTVAGTVGTLYVNGLAVATNNAMTLDPSALGSTTQNYLGKSQFAADPALAGSIDDFRIYGVALSAQQVQQLAIPSIVKPASASASPVTTTSTNLSVQAADLTAGESALTYSWATTGAPPAPVIFGPNGTNASKNITAAFSKSGTYNFLVTIMNPAAGLSTIIPLTVVVNQTVASITVTPASPTVAGGTTTTFSAAAFDQFSSEMSPEPVFNWGATTGSGSVDTSGNFTASQTGGSYTISATASSIAGSTTVNIVPTIYSAAGTYNVSVNNGVEHIAISGGPTYSISAASLPSLSFNGSGTTLVVDFTNGDAVPAGGLSLSPATGSNSLSVIGTSGNDTVKVDASTVTFGADAPITYANVQLIVVNGGFGADTFTQLASLGGGALLTFVTTSSDTLNINGGVYTIPASASPNSYPLSALNIANGARLVALTATSHTNRTVFVLGTLSIAPTGQMDLGGNDMIVHGNSLRSIVSDISQGFNATGTPWTGNGLTSSSAAATRNTALGAELNTSGSGRLVTTFDGQTVSSTDVLVKYTYFGDADLSGSVNAIDYTLIDNGFNTGGTPNGYFGGDFNYDGVINGDDYTLIDNAFNTQGSVSLAAQPALQIAPKTPAIKNPAAATPTYVPSSNPTAIFSTTPIPDSLADQIFGTTSKDLI